VDVAISPHIRSLREKVGHDLLVLPSVCVLPIDPSGRLLLVQEIETAQWQTIGGAIEPHESPREAGAREAHEEAGVVVELGRLIDALGGPGFEITYSNGDVVSYVTIVFEATITSGVPKPDGEETSAVAWWAIDDLDRAPMSGFTRLLFRSLPLRELLVPQFG
jgi:8-oxo-dGTP pyrophosphatase MutT (NUDIX family)